MEKRNSQCAVERLDPTAPEARPLRFLSLLQLGSSCSKPDLMTIAADQCRHGAGLDQEGGEGEEGKTLKGKEAGVWWGAGEGKLCWEEIVKGRMPWIMTFLAWSLGTPGGACLFPPPLLPIPSPFLLDCSCPIVSECFHEPCFSKHPWAQGSPGWGTPWTHTGHVPQLVILRALCASSI